MTFRWLLSLILILAAPHWLEAAPDSLDHLLKQVKQQQQEVSRLNRERESRFMAEKKQRQRLLAQAKAELAKLEKLSNSLKTEFSANQQVLAKLEEELQQSSGILGEIVGTVRQAAGDLKTTLKESLVSAQFPGRAEKLEAIADSKRLPTLEQLESLWYLYLHEMTESGKVTKFKSKILTAGGEPQASEVIRIGVFNALAQGQYLRYLPETEGLIMLPRQPERRLQKLAQAFMNASGDYAPLGIDPTRGVLLGMLISSPTVLERIHQGGLIGYIILALGAIGLLLASWRLIVLSGIAHKINAQLQALDTPGDDNPLGRVLLAGLQARSLPPETMENLLDEAILREIPAIERGLSLVKLITAVAPLLGLLGTVTGMIETFQSISLFGTGDPKLMASGISQALVTTMLGLIVAIPLLFIHSLLASRSKTLVQILEEQSAGVISALMEKRAA